MRPRATKAEREELTKRTREERKVAYLRLLTAARGLRFLSQGAAADEPRDRQREATLAARQAVDDFIKAAQSDLEVALNP